MPGQVRIGDLCICGGRRIGIYVTGSTNTFANSRQTVRGWGVDTYICPHCIGYAICGSPNTFVNSITTHRRNDCTIDCDGPGYALTASNDVIVN